MAYRDLIIKDWGWKLFSIMLATVIWFLVHAISGDFSVNFNPLDRTATRTIEHVPVDVVFAADEVRDIRMRPIEVRVTVRGRVEIVNSLAEGEIRATVDLRGLETGQKLSRHVTASAPPGVSVLDIAPREVEVEMLSKLKP